MTPLSLTQVLILSIFITLWVKNIILIVYIILNVNWLCYSQMSSSDKRGLNLNQGSENIVFYYTTYTIMHRR